MRSLILAVAACATSVGARSALLGREADDDEVTSLPGWSGPLPSKHYSGYLKVGALSGSPGMLHYWLQESENNPATDPVIMWINGGPGASGMIGMLTELGQLQVMPAPGQAPASTPPDGSPPTLYHNPFGWTKVGSLFTIEQPKGVGFSYCTGAGLCENTDESTAQDTYEAIVAFFERFPQLAARPFFVTGESYAGTYLPMLMDQIDQRGGIPNFRGAAIGNGCWGSSCFYGVTESQIDFHTFSGQMFLAPELREDITSACEGRWLNVTSTEGTCGGGGLDRCPQLLRQMCHEVGDGEFNVYNMYDTCYPSNGLSLRAVRERIRHGEVVLRSSSDALHTHPVLHVNVSDSMVAAVSESTSEAAAALGQLNDYACGGEGAMHKWLADAAVQHALHVQTSGGMHYKQTVGDLRPVYERLVRKYPILIYSGNADACVPTWGSEVWTQELGEKLGANRTAWRPWTSPSASPGSSKHVLAGYVTSWPMLSNFSFAVVKGAGHEVPRYKPAFALTMIAKWVKGEAL